MRSIIKDYLYYVIMLTIVIIICLVLYILYIWKQDQPANNDYYKDFAALKADTKAHKDWEINTKTTNNKDILITAIHGGGIEPGTSELAKIISKKVIIIYIVSKVYYHQTIRNSTSPQQTLMTLS